MNNVVSSNIIFLSSCSLADNRITDVPIVLCDDDDEFMDGLVGELNENKCDAILCPPGTFAAVGRQTKPDAPCEQCSGETAEERKERAPYFGSLKCGTISEERKILEELHGLIFTGKSYVHMIRLFYLEENNPIAFFHLES